MALNLDKLEQALLLPAIPWAVYQAWIDNTAWYYGANTRTRDEYNYVLGAIASEGGEVFDALKKATRRQDFGIDLAKRRMSVLYEMTDVLWYMTRACTLLGVTMEELYLLNMIKLVSRYREEKQNIDFDPQTLEIVRAWPLNNLQFDVALKWMRLIESRTTEASASTFTVTGTCSRPSSVEPWRHRGMKLEW